MTAAANEQAEWLEADGLGGFASGTVSGVRTRRYHALLLAAATPPTGRVTLVNGFDAHVQTAQGRYALSSQRYAPDVVWPDGRHRIAAFSLEPWPTWTFQLEDGTRVVQELFVPHGVPAVALAWRLEGEAPAGRPVRLDVRPFLSSRDYHALHFENPDADLRGVVDGARARFRLYAGQPAVVALSNGRFSSEPFWYRRFLYTEEQARGLDHVEDLAAPGLLQFDLAQGEARLVLYADLPQAAALAGDDAGALLERLRAGERARRARFGSRLERAADAYLVRRGAGRTIVAGYPWFTDWGRDTFIALRGLCLATGRLDEARAILLEWAGAVSQGMLPNRFQDTGDEPEFNSVDAALWYVVAVHDYLAAAEASGGAAPEDRERLRAAVLSILDGYAAGTRHGIRLDSDGLLAAGEPGVQLTWMDAKVGEWVVTPRIGKPVEVQALWLNALKIGAALEARFEAPFERGLASLRARFWNAERGCLFDVADAGHEPGRFDPALRPNQIFAVGGLPFALLDGEAARRVVDAVEAHLLTPLGLRSLAPGEPDYAPRYRGGVRERDGAYHQGTVWPWLMGPFVEAWVRVRGGGAAVKAEARRLFLEPLLRHLDEAGLGHISEVADGDAPHAPGGCPFQAWSVGEALRLDRVVLAAGGAPGRAAAPAGGNGSARPVASASSAAQGPPLLRDWRRAAAPEPPGGRPAGPRQARPRSTAEAYL
jgi:predicted glycogen debranching enzyme